MIELKPSFKYIMLEEAHGVHKLIIYKPNSKDSGVYTCSATNKSGTEELKHRVQFIKPMNFHVHGFFHAYDEISKEKEQRGKRARSEAIKSKEDADKRKGGDYIPRSRPEPEVTVPTKQKLKFATQLRDRTAIVGNKVKFTVSIIGPDPQIRWYRDDNPLQYGSKVRNMTSEGLSVVELLNVTAEQSGTYKCLARNNDSEVTTSCSLKVYDAKEEGDTSAPIFVLSVRGKFYTS